MRCGDDRARLLDAERIAAERIAAFPEVSSVQHRWPVEFFRTWRYLLIPNDYVTRIRDEVQTAGNGGSVNDPAVWGLRTIVTSAVPVGTAVVAAWQAGGMVYRKGGITVDATNSDEGKFKTNITTIRAEERVGLAVYRPAAFNRVTLAQPA